MTCALRLAGLLSLSLATTACRGGSSPTAPSSIATTNPAAVSANVSGTWLQGGEAVMTLAQEGATISGMTIPATVEFNGFSSVFAGTVTGIVSGDAVTLTVQNTVLARSGSRTVTCRGADSFEGQVSGNTLAGNLISSTTPYRCEGGMPLPAPQVSAPVTFTRR